MDKPHDVVSVVVASASDLPHVNLAFQDLLGMQPYGARVLERHVQQPRYQPAFTRIALINDQVVGAVLIRHIRLQLGAARLEAGMVEALVAPNPDVLQRLVGDLLNTLQDNGLALALTSGDPAILAAFGFAPYQFACATYGWQAANHQLRPLTEDDLEEAAALYSATYSRMLHEARTPPDWRAWLAGQRIEGLEDTRGRLVGYVQRENKRVLEAAVVDASAARALLGALGMETLALPLAHPLTQAALLGGGTTRISAPSEQTQPLAGVVDLPGLLEQLRPAFAARLVHSRYADWSGNIRLEIDTERVTLAITAGQPEVIEGSRPADVRLRRVSLVGLVQLALGYRAVSDLRATADLDCDDAALGLLDVLFPVL